MENLEKNFIPNERWMAAKYDEMNKQLFGGALGACDFAIFTSGKGSEGGVLGWFKITGNNIRVKLSTRRLIRKGGYRTIRQPNGIVVQHYEQEININSRNFVDLCKPRIELNGNYSGTEHGFLATLVHEMCHYYTYMNGYCPKQGHGREFKEIGMIVSSRSNGMFTVQRIASAEQMSELELNKTMQAKRDKRLANKKSRIYAVFNFTKDGHIELTTTSSQNVIDEILTGTRRKRNCIKTLMSNDQNLIEELFKLGYRKEFRTWRYWYVEGKPWLDSLLNGNYEIKEIYVDPSFADDNPKRQAETPRQEPTRIFSIKTNRGQVEIKFTSDADLKDQLRRQFPNMRDEVIEKIMANPNNYKMREGKDSIRRIVEGVINEFMRNEFRGADNDDETIDINPNMNLGEFSPLEMY